MGCDGHLLGVDSKECFCAAYFEQRYGKGQNIIVFGSYFHEYIVRLHVTSGLIISMNNSPRNLIDIMNTFIYCDSL